MNTLNCKKYKTLSKKKKMYNVSRASGAYNKINKKEV